VVNARAPIATLLVLALCGCGDSGSGPAAVALEGDTTCEKLSSLSEAKGCAPSSACRDIAAACESLGQAWLDCAAQDLDQCLCEGDDGTLNCEGSFKANEGPARCFDEYGALDACLAREDTSPDVVGEACLPEQVPETGFADTEAYLETSSLYCDGAPCLVYRLAGDPRPGCVPTAELPCADPVAVQERVHCTCRCNALDSGGDECECPDSFTCVTILEQGGPEVRGGYCVRNTP
jgi:hypothetical protein